MARIYAGLQQTLSQAGSAQDPAEIHGTLAGMLCLREHCNPLAALDDEASAPLREALGALRETTLEGLFDSQSGFALLLPDDSTPLEQRVRALAHWCSGFVYGLASQEDFSLENLSEEVQEVVRDLTELGKAALTADDDAQEQAENDYAELVEYVRVGAQLVFLELRPVRSADERERLH